MKRNLIFSSLFAAALAAAALASCDNNDEPTEALKLSPSALTVEAGKTATATVKGGTAPFTARTSNNDIAEATALADTITVTGKKKGQAFVTVTDKNNLTGRITVSVK